MVAYGQGVIDRHGSERLRGTAKGKQVWCSDRSQIEPFHRDGPRHCKEGSLGAGASEGAPLPLGLKGALLIAASMLSPAFSYADSSEPHGVGLDTLPTPLIVAEPLVNDSPIALLRALGGSSRTRFQGVPILSVRLLQTLYEALGDRLIWEDPARIAALADLAQSSVLSGFSPDDFHIEALRRFAEPGLLWSLSRTERLEAELVISDALLRFVHHHRYGKIDPVALDRTWHDRAPASSEKIIADFLIAVTGDDLSKALEDRFPAPFWYLQLKRAAERYQGFDAAGALRPLSTGSKLERGSRGPRVAALRHLLASIDADAVRANDPAFFDAGLETQVVAFQQRSGLTPDGVVGPATLAALNRVASLPLQDLIRINLERMRWLYDDLPEEYVFVDVAGFQVHLARSGEFVWTTRAIVGTPETQTPMFRDTLDHLVFNPTWTVPTSIQKKLGGVAGAYRLVDRRTGERVSGGDLRDYRRYRVIQEPGPKNALGRVKFMFPNHHAVYLHDTPNKGLFSREGRALSNGCVRVQDPLALAELLLDQSGWTGSGIEQMVDRGRTRYVNVDAPVGVLLMYFTAYADEEGRVGVRSDLYGRDEALLEAMSRPLVATRIAFPEPVEELAPAGTSQAAAGPSPAEPEPGRAGDADVESVQGVIDG